MRFATHVVPMMFGQFIRVMVRFPSPKLRLVKNIFKRYIIYAKLIDIFTGAMDFTMFAHRAFLI